MTVDNWSDVKFYFSGDGYFNAILQRIERAASEIRIEIYMFNFDELGKTILNALAFARRRGVEVYLLVDGVGTLGYLSVINDYCTAHRIHFRIYHPLPFKLHFLQKFSLKSMTLKNIRRFFFMFRKINNRDHRKIFLFDRQIAFVGSQNVNKIHSETLSKNKAWRDTGVELRGLPVEGLIASHLIAWEKSRTLEGLFYRWKLNHHVLQLNERRKHRLEKLTQLIRSINSAQERIWITTAYFLPNRKTLEAMVRAAKRGVNVCLCLPAISDMPFMKWTAWLLYDRLLKAGVNIYEYQDRILHAKTLIVDDWAAVGSYNLNHRSLIHDLEAQVVINKPQWMNELLQQWHKDISQSKEVKLNDKGHSSIFYRMLANIFYWFRYYL